jgi:hypothetical protein
VVTERDIYSVQFAPLLTFDNFIDEILSFFHYNEGAVSLKIRMFFPGYIIVLPIGYSYTTMITYYLVPNTKVEESGFGKVIRILL